jgi:cholesterol oxidase
MSHDDAGGQITLEDDRARIIWPGAGREPAFAGDLDMLGDVNASLHGEFLRNPLNSKPMGEQVVTVHPIGGCPMGDDWTAGVVDDHGRVYCSPDEVHDGLYVCDGAVLPGAVAVNPLLTITALAERSMKQLIEDRGWPFDVSLALARPGHQRFASPRPGKPVVGSPPGFLGGVWRTVLHWIRALWNLAWGFVRGILAIPVGWFVRWYINRYANRIAPGLLFSETMEGFVSEREVPSREPPWELISNPFDIAAAEGRAEGNAINFCLTIATDNLNEMVNGAQHRGTANGSVSWPRWSADPMTVTDGSFMLLPPDGADVNTWNMIYDFPLHRTDGPDLNFRGVKYLRQTDGSSPWTDLTTLYVTLSEGNRVLATGVMTLDLQDLIRQGLTVQVPPKRGWFNRIGFLRSAIQTTFVGRFAAFFGTTVLEAYGGLLADLRDFDELGDQHRTRRILRAPGPVVHTIHASDGCQLKLYRYCAEPAGGRPPVIVAPGYSVLAQSFAIDTTKQNMVEYLHDNGYDVWLFAYRASPDSGSSTTDFTMDDIARRDWPAAVQHVRAVTGQDVQVVAHCVASMTVLMALLEGTEGVRSAICSQTSLHPVVGWMNDFKADTGLAQNLRRLNPAPFGMDFKKVNLVSSTKQSDRTLDVALWTLPVPDGEACTSPVCRRVFALWGPSYTHDQLNRETHIAMREMFGEVSTKAIEQMSDITAAGKVIDADGNDSYLPNVANLTMPIDFVAGSKNLIFLPESSQRTFDWLVAHNGQELYTRHVFEGYAHMDLWIGKDAARDIYPYILDRLRAHRPMAASAD